MNSLILPLLLEWSFIKESCFLFWRPYLLSARIRSFVSGNHRSQPHTIIGISLRYIRMVHVRITSSSAYNVFIATTSLFHQDRLVEKDKNRKKNKVKAARSQHGRTATLGLLLGGTSQVQYRVLLCCVCLQKCTVPAVLLQTLLADFRTFLLVALQASGDDSTSNTCGPV
jgi:hypothetical protein